MHLCSIIHKYILFEKGLVRNISLFHAGKRDSVNNNVGGKKISKKSLHRLFACNSRRVASWLRITCSQ